MCIEFSPDGSNLFDPFLIKSFIFQRFRIKRRAGRRKASTSLVLPNGNSSTTKNSPKTSSIISLQFRYASTQDKIFIFLGVITGIATGVVQPLNMLIFGQLTGDIIMYGYIVGNSTGNEDVLTAAKDDFMQSMLDFVLYSCLLGAATLIMGYASIAFFNISGIKQVILYNTSNQTKLYRFIFQVLRIRSLFFEKALNQDISWYDKNQTGDIASRITEYDVHDI